MGFVLEREHAPLADPHTWEEQLRVAVDELRTPGDVGIDPLEAAVVNRHYVVFDCLDEPKPLQLSKFLGVLRSEIARLSPVVRAVELPHVVLERWWRICLPRSAVLGDGRPALKVDAAVAHHLEVLHLVGFRCRGAPQRVQHAHALQWRLRDPVHQCRCGDSGSLQNRGRHVDHMLELVARLALVVQAIWPVHDRAIAGAAPVRRHLFGPLVGRAPDHGPSRRRSGCRRAACRNRRSWRAGTRGSRCRACR